MRGASARARDLGRADRSRYFAYLGPSPGPAARLRVLLVTEGLWALWALRFAQYLAREAPRPLRPVINLFFKPARRIIEHLTGIHLSAAARIGPGLYIGHHGGIWVSPRATLGANCSLAQGVTIGVAGRAPHGPVLGDRVWVGPNATISGPVRIGSGSVVAANSLVVADVPVNGVAVGVPARVISLTGSAHLLRLPQGAPPEG